jgi:hypothetical protein
MGTKDKNIYCALSETSKPLDWYNKHILTIVMIIFKIKLNQVLSFQKYVTSPCIDKIGGMAKYA